MKEILQRKKNYSMLPLGCDFCDYRCKLFLQLKLHINTHFAYHNVASDDCGSNTINISNKTLKNAETITESCSGKNLPECLVSRIICNICYYECHFIIQLRIHKKVRHGDGVSSLLYADKELSIGDNFEKALLRYFVKKSLNIATETNTFREKTSEGQKSNIQKVDVPVKSGGIKIFCEYCEFECQYSIQLKVHKSKCAKRKALNCSDNSKEEERFQCLTGNKTRNETNVTNCNVVNDKVIKSGEKKGLHRKSFGEENELNDSNGMTKVVPYEISKENNSILQNVEELLREVDCKLKSFENSDDKEFSLKYQSPRKWKNKSQYGNGEKCKETKKEDNCFEVQNLKLCKADDIKDFYLKERESFQSKNTSGPRNAIDYQVENDKIKKLQADKKAEPERKPFGKENEVNNGNKAIKIVLSEASKKNNAVLQNTKVLTTSNISWKLESFVNTDHGELSTNYKRNRKKMKKSQYEDKRRQKVEKEKNCHGAQNVSLCKKDDIKDSDIQLDKGNTLQDYSKESNLTFSCSLCTYKCKFAVELRIHENIHRPKSFKINPVLMNAYRDSISCKVPNGIVKDKDFNVAKDIEEVVKLDGNNESDAVIVSKTKEIHPVVTNKRIPEEIDKTEADRIVSKTKSIFFCCDCDYKCNIATQLLIHRRVFHKDYITRKTSSYLELKLRKNSLSGKCYVLLRDSDKFAVKLHLVKQKMKKLKSDCNVILSSPNSEKLSCNYCSFKCKFPNQLSVHKNIHNAEVKHCTQSMPEMYKNDQCNSVGTVAKSLKRSHSKYHFGSDIRMKYFCNMCDYKFNTLKSLDKHKSYHIGRNHFACKFCIFETHRFNLLQGHMKKHKILPYFCNFCDYKCKQLYHLERHVEIHLGLKPFVCSDCGFRSAQKVDLQKHMVIHTSAKPFICKICNFKTKDKHTMNRHQKIHNCEKPYACHQCHYRSRRPACLVRHKIHQHSIDNMLGDKN